MGLVVRCNVGEAAGAVCEERLEELTSGEAGKTDMVTAEEVEEEAEVVEAAVAEEVEAVVAGVWLGVEATVAVSVSVTGASLSGDFASVFASFV